MPIIILYLLVIVAMLLSVFVNQVSQSYDYINKN